MKLNIFFKLLLFTLIIVSISSYSVLAQSEKIRTQIPDTTNLKAIIKSDSSKSNLVKSGIIALNLSPILNKVFHQQIITKSDIESSNYNFTKDLFNSALSSYSNNLASGASPTDISLFGLTAASTAFLNDGINFTNRLTNFTNLNLFQTESIDSIEVIPLSRGFLLGNWNISAINFISREPSAAKPYSRIKYLQSPVNEGMIDGIFSLSPYKKLNAYFEITNHGSDSYYANSKFSNWMGNIRLSYVFSPTSTLRLNYKQTNSTINLNGGVDLLATQNDNPNFALNDLVYDNINAVERFINRYLVTQNKLLVTSLITKLSDFSLSEISIYYKDDLLGFRQNFGDQLFDNLLHVKRDNISTTYGIRLRQDLQVEFLRVTSITVLEKTKHDSPLLGFDAPNKNPVKNSQTSFSTSAIATLNSAENKFHPSGFAKYLNLNGNGFLGFGADVFVNLTDKVSLFAGASSFSKPNSLLEQKYLIGNLAENSQQIKTFEIKALADFGSIKLCANYFSTSNSNSLNSAFAANQTKLNDEAFFVSQTNSSVNGISLKAQFEFWKIQLITNSTLYLSKEEQIKNGLPQFASNGGVYFFDTLFSGNLHLKTGFNYFSYGSRYEQRFDFEKGIASSYLYNFTNNSYYQINAKEFSPSFQLDFFLAGRIQESAIVYFSWENILNAQYFVVPYYPAYPRWLRFGIAWEFLD